MDQSFPSITNERSRRDALDALRGGGVLVLPTDTLYGFSAALSAGEAVRRIGLLKGSPDRKRYIVLAASVDMAARYVGSFGCIDRDRLERAWPAPLTVVLPAGELCPEWVGESVAIRIPALSALTQLIERLGEPIVSTSVNKSGAPPLADLGDIVQGYGEVVDMIVAGPRAQRGVASTIVDLTGDRPSVLRHGDYDWEASG